MEILAREQWRIERIRKAVAIAAKVIDVDDAQLAALVHEIDDIQGLLVVRWRHPMTDTQTRAFRLAWELCGESQERTQHVVSW